MDWSFLVEKRFKSGQKCTYQQFFRPLYSKMLTKMSTRYQQSYQQLLLINSCFCRKELCNEVGGNGKKCLSLQLKNRKCKNELPDRTF